MEDYKHKYNHCFRNSNTQELLCEYNLMNNFPSVCHLDPTEILARKYEVGEKDSSDFLLNYNKEEG